jgi:hypothetical protein
VMSTARMLGEPRHEMAAILADFVHEFIGLQKVIQRQLIQRLGTVSSPNGFPFDLQARRGAEVPLL